MRTNEERIRLIHERTAEIRKEQKNRRRQLRTAVCMAACLLLVVGIGINLHPNPAWPEEVQAVAGAISDFGKPPRRAELAAAVLNHFEDVYALLDQGKEPELLEQYRERLCCIDRPVTVISPAGRYEAECVGLDENAHLLVKTADGQVNALSSGEISIRL